MLSNQLSMPSTRIPRAMLAMRVHEFGGPHVIHAEEIEVPQPGPEEILVRVDAAGVGPWDAWIRSGSSVLPQPLPLTLGSDIAGTIVACGDPAANVRIGEEVYGVTNLQFTGGYAEFACCNAAMLATKPKSLKSVQAASAPVIAVTAWQMLFDHGRAVSGQSVLVHGAAGNVGKFAVQLAKAAGLRVLATASEPHRTELLKLGADVVLGRTPNSSEQVDLVVDLVGTQGNDVLFDTVRSGGALISAVNQPDAGIAAEKGIHAKFMLVDVRTDVLGQLATMFDTGKLVTEVGDVLPLAEARRAHEMLNGSVARKCGKIVLSARE
jgi:NADPH:quinone reductase-like Zn-dependent oxidoreductase